MATIKQKLAVDALVENGGNVSQAMLKVGYSPATAKTPQKLTESDGFKDIISTMENERLEALREAITKRNKANYRDLINATDTLTKNVQLLSGKATENKAVIIILEKPLIDKREALRNVLNSSPNPDSQ